MIDRIKIDLNSVEAEKREVISMLKKQLEEYCNLKKSIEKVQWADSKYDALVDAVNQIGAALSDALQSLTNGSDVYVITQMRPLAEEYLENIKRFPRM